MASASSELGWSRDEAADADPGLTRKRQRLSEEAETSPLSTDGDVVIEALPPDEIGSSFDNAIALDDDSAMSPITYSNSFGLATNGVSPFDQISWLCDQVCNGLYINIDHFCILEQWLAGHLVDTRDEPDLYLEAYAIEHEFFGKLGQTCFALVERQEHLFDNRSIQRFGAHVLRNVVDDLFTGMHELSLRMLRLLPSLVDNTIARRDSGQVSKSRQHVGLLWYALILAQTLACHRAAQTVPFFRDILGCRMADLLKQHRIEFVDRPECFQLLLELLKKLVHYHRELTNAWDGIDAVFSIFLALGLGSGSAARTVMDLAHMSIQPVVCEKHPRALPDSFHELSIRLPSALLTRLVSDADADEVAAMYECYIKSETDALILESADETSVVKLLQDVCGGEHGTLVELMTTAWTLARLKSFIYSDIMDVRSCGISLLSAKLLELYNAHRAAKENFEHPVLQYVARFMRANELTKYIFGPNSHASLVNHSQNIIGFLAATFAYTNLESDIIWHACTNSVETEFVKASFTVLSDLCRYLDLDHLLYLANKYAITPPSKLGKDAVESLTDLFQRVQIKNGESNEQKHRLATAFISIDIMMRVAEVQEHPLLSQLRDIARSELSRFRDASYSHEDRAQIFSRCIPNLINVSEHATTSVEIIALFLPCIKFESETQNLLDMLPIQAVVDELSRFVDSRRHMPAGGSQLAISIRGLQIRLEFILRLMALPGSVVEDDTRESLFRYTVGEMGLNNLARDCCWNSFMSFRSAPDLTMVADDLISHFLDTGAIELDLQFVTPNLIRLFSLSLQSQAKTSSTSGDLSQILEATTWRRLVHAAESATALQVSQPATEALCQVLFEYPRHSEEMRLAAVKCHADFARQQISHIREDFARLDDAGSATLCQKLCLFDAVLRKSRQTASSFSHEVATDIPLATEPQDELFQCTLQVYCGGQSQPKTYMLQANPSTIVSELIAKLPSLTGAAENRVIVGGKALDVELQSNDTLAKLGVQASGGILISPKHTMESDLDIVLTSPGTVERELLTHFDDLERLLDGPDDVASKAFQFLATITPPAQVRQRVASPETHVQELFPLNTNPWRSAYSLHVLNVHRQDFAKIGVADNNYMVQGVRLLVAVLTDNGRAVNVSLFIAVLSTLTRFLQERPANAPMLSWIDEPAIFVDRLIDICKFAVQCPREQHESRSALLVEAFKTLFQAIRVQESIWQSFAESPRALDLHKGLFFAVEHCFSTDVITMIKDICVDSSLPEEVADFYTKTLLRILPDALAFKHRAPHFFFLAIEATLANRVLHRDEARVQDTANSLLSTLWSYQHTEFVDLPVVDQAMLGLLKLLLEVVQILKSFKKPLALPDLPTKLMARLLFPPYKELSSKPLVDSSTRLEAYKLAQATCETESDFMGLLDAAKTAMYDTSGHPRERFPGLDSWLRPAFKCSGLPNLGMTCYMNSLLQQLFANVHFRKFIFEVPIVDQENQVLLYEVQRLFAQMQDSACGSPDTAALAKVLDIQTDSQEDVHGFYEDLLARLEASMPNDTWKATLNRFYTGKQVSQIKGECGHVSPKTEPFVDLPVIIKNKTCLPESLDEFVQGEPMQGANRYKCQACDSTDGGRLVDAVRRSCPEELPNNLTFCLKRFTFEAMLGVEGKVNDRFEFPQAINMTPYKAAYLDNPTAGMQDDVFELVGVIVHQGTLHLGHYWSYTLLRNTANPCSRTWVKLEDRNVSLVQGGIQEVQQECFGGQRYTNGNERADNAYVLFYERRASLEERIALPGLIIDPSTSLLLPPKVAPPPHLAAEIHQGNAWRHRIGHLFHDDFALFVSWLLDHYRNNYRDQRLDARKYAATTDSDLSSDAEGSASSLPSDEELAADHLVQQVSDLAVTYLQRIVVSDSAPGRRMGFCINALASLQQAQPEFAVLFLNRIAQNDKWFEGVIQHDNKKVRSMIGDFIILSLTRVREHGQAFYHRAFQALAETHSRPTKGSPSPPMLDWVDYFKFAASLANLGQAETEIVLDSGYWKWALDLLHMPNDFKKKYPGLMEHFRTNPAKVVALYEFIHSILNGHVDLISSLTNPESEGYRTQGPDGLVLHEDELEFLNRHCAGDNREMLVWMRSSKWAKQQCAWRESAPGKLVGLLCSRKSSAEMATGVTQSLIRYIDFVEENLPNLIAMTMHYCDNCGSEEAAFPVFKTLAKVMHMWESSDKEFLQILPDAFEIVPGVVVATMDVWTSLFLLTKNGTTRDETTQWMAEKVFGVDPLSKSSDLDAERARQARRLVKTCCEFLNESFQKARSRSRHEGTIKLMLAVGTFLQTLQAQVGSLVETAKYEVNVKLRTEVDEIPTTLVLLKDLETDVLNNWQLEAAGLHQVQDVRASVEASEGFASSEEWDDDDDDESVALD